MSKSIEVKKKVNQMSEFLMASWEIINNIIHDNDWDNDPYFLDEWFDRNWELIVGRHIFGRECNIQPFTASINDVIRGKYSTYIIVTYPVKGILLCIGTQSNGFEIAPPFNMVKALSNDSRVVVSMLHETEFDVACKLSE